MDVQMRMKLFQGLELVRGDVAKHLEDASLQQITLLSVSEIIL